MPCSSSACCSGNADRLKGVYTVEGVQRTMRTKAAKMAVAAAVIALGATACSTARAATPPLAIGQGITLTESDSGPTWTVRVNSVREVKPGQYDNLLAGLRYVVIDVSYVVDTGPVDISETDWWARDPDGITSVAANMGDLPDGLDTATLQSDSTAEGTVMIQVPHGPGTIIYTADGMTAAATWVLPGD